MPSHHKYYFLSYKVSKINCQRTGLYSSKKLWHLKAVHYHVILEKVKLNSFLSILYSRLYFEEEIIICTRICDAKLTVCYNYLLIKKEITVAPSFLIFKLACVYSY